MTAPGAVATMRSSRSCAMRCALLQRLVGARQRDVLGEAGHVAHAAVGAEQREAAAADPHERPSGRITRYSVWYMPAAFGAAPRRPRAAGPPDGRRPASAQVLVQRRRRPAPDALVGRVHVQQLAAARIDDPDQVQRMVAEHAEQLLAVARHARRVLGGEVGERHHRAAPRPAPSESTGTARTRSQRSAVLRRLHDDGARGGLAVAVQRAPDRALVLLASARRARRSAPSRGRRRARPARRAQPQHLARGAVGVDDAQVGVEPEQARLERVEDAPVVSAATRAPCNAAVESSCGL
jgi:hypothetical protein